MGGIFGGGGGSQTVTQSNIPFNADQLRTVDNAAINLLNNNPLSYYPGQTYANPNPYQTNTLNSSANFYGNAGNVASSDLGNQQQDALTANQNLVNGGALAGANPYISSLFGLGSQNPGATASANLGTAAYGSPLGDYQNGSFFNNYINQNVGDLGNAASSGPGATPLNNISNGLYFNNEQPFINDLSNAGISGPGAGGLAFAGNGQGLNMLSPYTSGLQGVANGGPAAGQLAATANGQYLGSNPYLDATFQAAANPVVNAYMTATSPQTDSMLEQYGRFSSQDTGRSGADTSLQSVNQQNLGKTLSDLSAGIYEPAYQQERSNMVNAATNLGNLQTNALQSGGALTNQGINSLIAGAEGQGNLYTSGVNSGLAGYNSGVGQIAGAGNSLLSGNISGLSDAGSIYNSTAGTTVNAANSYSQNLIDSLYKSGLINTTGQNAQTTALQGALGGYYGGLGIQQGAIGATPGLSGMGASDYQTALSAGNNMQQLDQQSINDLMNRYYGTQFAPYQTLGQVAGIVGSGIPGTTAETTPIGGSPLGSLLSGVSGANSLFGSSGLFGSGGALGSGVTNGGLLGSAGPLFGAGGLFGAAPTVDALAGEAGSASLASLGLEAPSAGGAILSDFLPFLGL